MPKISSDIHPRMGVRACSPGQAQRSPGKVMINIAPLKGVMLLPTSLFGSGQEIGNSGTGTGSGTFTKMWCGEGSPYWRNAIESKPFSFQLPIIKNLSLLYIFVNVPVPVPEFPISCPDPNFLAKDVGKSMTPVRDSCKSRKGSLLDLFRGKLEKHKKVILRHLPF